MEGQIEDQEKIIESLEIQNECLSKEQSLNQKLDQEGMKFELEKLTGDF